MLYRLAPFIFLILWSGGYAVAKIGLAHANPLTLLSLRYFCVVALLLPAWLVIRPELPHSPRAWFDLLWVGFLIQVVYFGSAWTAFSYGGSAGTVALITSMHPIIVALVMPFVSSERSTWIRWLGLVCGFCGSLLVIVGNQHVQVVSIAIIGFSLAALLAFSSATVWEKRYGVTYHPLTANVAHYLLGFMCTLPLAWLLEPMRIDVTPAFVGALAYLVLGNSILAISLFLLMVRRGEATRVSALFFLVPPTSALIAWFLLGEQMSQAAWVGMALAAIGVWLVTRQGAGGASRKAT